MANAKAFYFTSDFLKSGDAPVYQIADFNPQTDTIKFTLNNYADDFRTSQTDISYNITVNGSSDRTGTIGGGTKSSVPVELSIAPSAFTDGKARITVSAEVTYPYRQTLSGIYELVQILDAVSHTVLDTQGDNIATLVVTTSNKSGTVTIAYPNTLAADNTDTRLSFASNSCSFEAKPYGQYTFVFFKANPNEVFSQNNFTVTIN